MFRIGDFAALGRVSSRALRLYDAAGLLAPARVDPLTGYRSYAADQLPRLHRILALREAGLGLAAIRELLDGGLSADQVAAVLRAARAEAERGLVEHRARVAALDAQLRRLGETGDPHPAHDVVVRPVPAQLVAFVRAVGAEADDLAPAFEAAERVAAADRARRDAPPLAVLHGNVAPAGERAVDAAVPLTRRIPQPAGPAAHRAGGEGLAGRVRVTELPALPAAACVVHRGGYGGLTGAATALLTAAEARGLRVAGPPREVYLRFGAAAGLGVPPAYLAADDADYVTELQLPVAEGGR